MMSIRMVACVVVVAIGPASALAGQRDAGFRYGLFSSTIPRPSRPIPNSVSLTALKNPPLPRPRPSDLAQGRSEPEPAASAPLTFAPVTPLD
jgi:hypothetical protein